MGKIVDNPVWEQSADADRIVASAKSAIAGILVMGSDVIEEHKKALISRMLWKITEANGKYTTRFQSEGARKNRDALRHDHVWTRKQMVEHILADPRALDSEIDRALGCTVTKTEHDELTRFDRLCDGWKRYKRAGIRVWDQKDRVWLSLDDEPAG